MEQQERQIKLPPQLLLLDMLGAILMGVGLADWLANTSLVPESMRFENYDIVMVVVGGLMMLPPLIYIVRTALELRRSA
ncbi:DUF1418 family protein [endosymbiont of Ridgeia piscesae]|jgi:ACR3 family arsenite efflux pump ArsB|uniref:Uncharacterized protein n=1 Tax=endosymbiont of Ridgeia piscesae TaxID=54398 RepID=A0A0T5Z6Z4_9GAMM|nr:DUF1418 family protein [endosymbiont of Ridgeia piscesae]KRT54170.1 Protein of unknown function (DUF1418) [endosymbiont of Ridgeia piscesae]KRT58401.1 Protein of unknown function (DUF1418) [endosymbiont of Ridgeia piscesae]